ncbi:pyrroline-5-carboxylate reductase family protein [Sphingomonas abaci]|uniref:Pyrroline-5-carboxylate reductase n=1 Tax=Sphingomonas abaci TaxID=237611 RepID=A0A7W7ALW8_9SPHN|nr:pyrroline-5-carboxylate reductase dimerization domain-containing protein [Sphingomonas abaci]MBB4618554.1 pyrroline-5-carboxylate reductase [Sphingomonas abaci]
MTDHASVTDMAALPQPLWMIGCGNMGGAMLRGWMAAGLDPASVTVVTRSGLGAPGGVRSVTELPPDERPATLVLAVKPQQLDTVAPLLAGLEPELLVSILAGVEADVLARRIPARAVVRAMPNLPVAIRQGVTALFSTSEALEVRRAAEALARPLGLAEWIADERSFDAVTALAGCGPGFVFRFADALAAAGTALGLPPEQARRLAVATLAGAGAMALQADVPPATLADRVASPGGSTRKGLDVLDADDALIRLLTATLSASERRNAEMAAAARG